MLFILTWSDFVPLDHLGNVMLDTQQASEIPQRNIPTWQQSLPLHSVENVGDAGTNNVQVEIKCSP